MTLPGLTEIYPFKIYKTGHFNGALLLSVIVQFVCAIKNKPWNYLSQNVKLSYETHTHTHIHTHNRGFKLLNDNHLVRCGIIHLKNTPKGVSVYMLTD